MSSQKEIASELINDYINKISKMAENLSNDNDKALDILGELIVPTTKVFSFHKFPKKKCIRQ